MRWKKEIQGLQTGRGHRGILIFFIYVLDTVAFVHTKFSEVRDYSAKKRCIKVTKLNA